MIEALEQIAKLLAHAPTLMAVCLGFVEALKRLGVQGKASLIASLVSGCVMGVLAYLAEFNWPTTFAGALAALVFGLLMGYSASGIYDFMTGRVIASADNNLP